MNQLDIEEPQQVKQEHSEIFTLRSIGSEDQTLQLIPAYSRNSQFDDYKSGHWSAKQHIKYIMFLDFFSDIFTIKHNKKLWKIFTIMSAFIKTRNSSQCRSHHQKNQRKHQSIEEILKIERLKYNNYDTQFDKIKNSLRKLPIHNPIEVQKQRQTQDFISSIKVLQENIEYKVYKNSISMIDIDMPKKSHKIIKNRGSQKIISYPKEKYIGSQVSIQMQDQSQQLSQGKIKSLGHAMQPQQAKQKNSQLFEYIGQNSYKKDQKLDKTADSYIDEGHKLINNPNKASIGLIPSKQGLNSDNGYQLTQLQLKSSSNIVRMKKTRSSLPSFDFIGVDQDQLIQFGKRLRHQKKQSLQTTEGKCKTLPPRSSKEDNQESWMSQKIFFQQRAVGKSLFSGFVSSIDSINKNFEINQKGFRTDQYTSFNNFCYQKEFSSDEQNLIHLRKQKSMSEAQIDENHCNLLFCDDKNKGNLCNQISDGEFEDSIQFVSNEALINEQKQQDFNDQKFDNSVRNFIKKGSKQAEYINNHGFIEQKISHKSSQIEKKSGFRKYIEQKQQQNCVNFEKTQFIQGQRLQNSQRNWYHSNKISYPSLCNQLSSQLEQYPLFQYKFYKFVEFFIYFMFHKIAVNNIFYQSQ